MKAIYRLLACAALVAAPVLFAQTYDMALPAGQTTFTCSPGGGLYCYGIPVYLNGDTSQPESGVWVDVNDVANGGGFVCFPPAEAYAVITPTPLSYLGCGPTVDAGTMVVTYGSFTSGGHTLTLPATVAFSFGNKLGTMALTLGHYLGAGRYPSWHTTVTGATLIIN